jgi:hypothetical protein
LYAIQAVAPELRTASTAGPPDVVVGANGPSRITSRSGRASISSDRVFQRSPLEKELTGPPRYASR